jgi:hypothetical protein
VVTGGGDTTPPETTITTMPPSSTTSTTATFEFTSTESPSTFQCSLDGGGFASCTSPKQYTGLSAGGHTFSVKATDASNNTDLTPASYGWTVQGGGDITPPVTTITAGPANLSKTTSTSATFEFTSDEAGSTYECRLDGGTWEPCTSPKEYTNLSLLGHTFEVYAIDLAGNPDPTPEKRIWKVIAATSIVHQRL